MYKFCKLCGSSLNLEDFEPKSDIYQIMEKENLCFKCAFWTWRKREDKALQLLHDNQDLFLAKLRKEEVDDTVPWESFEQSDETLLKRYPKWWFGRPIIINNEHWIFHYGFNEKSSYFERYNSILLDDGTIIPAMLSSQTMGGLTHQGNIPERFMGYPLILEDIPTIDSLLYGNPDENDFSPNAIYLTQEDEEYIRSLIEVDHKTKPYHLTKGLVPEKFVKKLFEKFYIK